MSLHRINKRLNALTVGKVELVKGEGYHYFEFNDSDPKNFDTESHMVCYTSHLTDAQWVEYGLAYYRKRLEYIKLKKDLGDPQPLGYMQGRGAA